MKQLLVSSERARATGRLDSWYHLSPGARVAAGLAAAEASGVRTVTLGDEAVARVWAPNRFKRAYASSKEISVPYLRPYDVFEYLPQAADYLSTTRTKRLDKYRLREGMILQSCSGRNLGPAILVDEYLAQFVLSHDMLRIEIDDQELRYYVLAFLQSVAGQQLLRRDKSGSVIDHISEDHVRELRVPIFPASTEAARLMQEAVTLRGRARTKLAAARATFEKVLPKIERKKPRCLGWTTSAKDLTGRIDAAFYDPLVGSVRKSITGAGGQQVKDVARVVKPAGRYKTRYVSPEHGRHLLSGTQVLQAWPINLKYLATAALRDATRYELHEGWIVYQADGRAEEGLGRPSVVTADRERWLASGHVGRVIAEEGTDWGWLYLALSTPHAQLQIKASSSGSVVDSTFEWDMEAVVLPNGEAGSAVRDAWRDFSKAAIKEAEARAVVERAITGTAKG